MKTFKLNSVMLLLLIVSINSCKKDTRELNENLSPVKGLSLPADQASVKLEPTTNAVVIFEWEDAQAEDGNMVLYEIAFDKENGDFSKPFYKTISDGGGVETQITITHKDLTKIAAMGGIESSSTGKLIWTIIASKSTNQKISPASRGIQLERPAGFAEVPAALYLTGSATEGSDDVTKAVALKKLEEGVFEIYTSLKPGTYQLTDKPSSDGKKFYVEGTVIKEGASSVTVTGATKVYRLKYDFNVASVLDATEIQSMGLFMSAYNKEIGQLAYAGNGTWESPVIAVEFYQFSWGRDERYKFAVHTPTEVQYLGSMNIDNGSPIGQAATYFHLTSVTNDQWNNTFKFNPSADMHNVKVTVNFSTTGPYTHEVATL